MRGCRLSAGLQGSQPCPPLACSPGIRWSASAPQNTLCCFVTEATGSPHAAVSACTSHQVNVPPGERPAGNRRPGGERTDTQGDAPGGCGVNSFSDGGTLQPGSGPGPVGTPGRAGGGGLNLPDEFGVPGGSVPAGRSWGGGEG